jgi:hypothetical protein
MTAREQVEACADREAAARRVYQDAVTTAGIVKRKARDALFLLRDTAYNVLRQQIADLRRKPRTWGDETDLEIEELEAQRAKWKASPPPLDFSTIDAAYDEAVTLAGNELAGTLRKIFYDRLHGAAA